MISGASLGGLLNGGLGELVERFKQNGQGETAQLEWAPGAGQNQTADLTMGRICCSSNCTGLM